MSDIDIKVENLGKCYIIGHENSQRYTALRDVISNTFKNYLSKTKYIFKGGQLISGEKLEEFWALKNINFEVKRGDRVGIIGRNGAGKSTLLKILSRITEPTTGRIQIHGRVASLLEVGTGFHPELTGRENTYLNGAILGMKRAEIKRKFDEIVAFAEVEKFIDTPVKRYSSGMYVRLAFAVAAHLETEILIVDEVLAVGDAEFQKKCIGKLEAISTNESKTILFVSHNMAAVKTLCNYGILLNNGEILERGSIDSIISKYLKYKNSKLEFLHLKGNQEIKIEKVIINNKEFEEDLRIYEEINIEIFFTCKKNILFKKVEFFVIIYDENDNDVVSIFQRDSEELFLVHELKERTILKFDNNLKPGRYRVSIGIFNEFREFVDWVDNCYYINVNDLFISGEKFDQRLGKVFLKENFKSI